MMPKKMNKTNNKINDIGGRETNTNNNNNNNNNNNVMVPFIRSKRRASDTLLATATALLKVLGVNSKSNKGGGNSTTKRRRKGSLFDKLNGQQQVLSSTMPAMPKEKTSPIPLNECNFVEMKMKEQLVGSSGIQVPTQTTSTGKLITTKMPENILQDCSNITTMQQQQQQNKSVTPTQTTTTTKLYSSSCNDICSSNNYTIRRTSATDIVSNTTIQSSKGKNELITSPSSMTIMQTPTTLSSLLNGSGGNNGSTTTNLLLNSKNDINNKILNNGITKMNPLSSSVTQSGFTTTTRTTTSGNNCCNKMNNLSTTKNNGVITTTQSVTTTTATTNIPSSSGSTSTQSTSSNASIKSNLSAIKNNSNHVSSPSSSSSTSNGTVGMGGVPPKKTAKDYVFGKIIGEGSFSTVCLARDIHTNREYAIKICYKPHILREKKQEYVRREREVMHIMNNVPGFVNLSCTFQDYRNLYFVMTLAKNGDLLPYINKVGSFDLDCTRHYAAELVLAIENMHKRGVIHRDLKPENILLDENMHTLIADFGSAKVFDVNQYNDTLTETITTTTQKSTSSTRSSPLRGTTSDSPIHRKSSSGNDNNTEDDDDDDDDDDNDSPRPIRRRRGSFVGTAQYVSPEVLQGEIVTRSADLWALGCIIYQMISGLPPFRGGSDYLIFKQIMNLNLIFPEGFDKDAEDLVRNLIKLDPKERLGSKDNIGKYESLRKHSFFSNINWDNIRYISPPQIYPYLPGVSKDEELRSHYRVPDNLEPGLDDKQLTRLLGLELGTITGIDRSSSISSSDTSSSSIVITKAAAATTTTIPTTPITATTLSSSPSSLLSTEKKTDPKNNINLNLTENEKQRRLEIQKKTDKWHTYAEGEIILKRGLINKRKGLFARKRMLLLTTGPRLIYIDPVQMVKKGEIPWSPALRVEPKNFKIFFVHTPNRTYYLEDPEGYALEWVNTIEDVRQKTYGDKS